MVEMCGANGSAGACHRPQQITGDTMMKALATKYDFHLDVTTNASQFTDSGLAPYDVVIFNQVGNNPFTPAQETAFVKYMWNGGGYVGWHASAANHDTWPWYVDSFMFADNAGHGAITACPIKLDSANKNHPCITGTFDSLGPQRLLSDTTMADEWYTWNPSPTTCKNLKVLGWVTENGKTWPMMWCQEFCKGGARPARMWYSNVGHENVEGGDDFYTNSWFQQSIVNALRWAAHIHAPGDYSQTFTSPPYGCALSGTVHPQTTTCRQDGTMLQALFDHVKHGSMSISVFSISGKKIPVGALASLRELRKAIGSGCHIVRISDASGYVVGQWAAAE
jgi:hypothetical protein